MTTLFAPVHGRPAPTPFRSNRFFLELAAALVLFSCVPGIVRAQEVEGLQPPGFADYGKWETLSLAGDRGGLSPDGRWITFAIGRTNGENELRILKVGDGATEVVPFGAQPVYSVDSRWLAYRIGQSEAERERMRERDEPVQNKLGLRHLPTGEAWTIDGIESFTFSPDGRYLAMRRYPPEVPRGESRNGQGGSRGGTPGTTVLLRDLETGRDMTFGNVAQLEWMDVDDSHLLAMVINAEDKLGNGVHLFDPGTGGLRVLESSEAVYGNLTWRTDAPDLAVLRSKEDEAMEGPTQVILAWTGLRGNEAVLAYDPGADPAFPSGMRIVPFRPLSWASDGSVIFLGITE